MDLGWNLKGFFVWFFFFPSQSIQIHCALTKINIILFIEPILKYNYVTRFYLTILLYFCFFFFWIFINRGIKADVTRIFQGGISAFATHTFSILSSKNKMAVFEYSSLI